MEINDIEIKPQETKEEVMNDIEVINEDDEVIEIPQEPVMKEKKPAKKFKEYYQDPEFKKKHLEKLKVKVMCECGTMISKGNKTNHFRTKKHIAGVTEANNRKRKEEEREKDIEKVIENALKKLVKENKIKLK